MRQIGWLGILTAMIAAVLGAVFGMRIWKPWTVMVSAAEDRLGCHEMVYQRVEPTIFSETYKAGRPKIGYEFTNKLPTQYLAC